jgi:hypothetical protein
MTSEGFPLARPMTIAVSVWIGVAGIAACAGPREDRVAVPSADPPIACPQTTGLDSVQDPSSAITAAKDAFASVYQKAHPISESPGHLAQFEPYTAVLKDGVWHVQGTAPQDYGDLLPVASVCQNGGGASVTWLKMPHIVM